MRLKASRTNALSSLIFRSDCSEDTRTECTPNQLSIWAGNPLHHTWEITWKLQTVCTVQESVRSPSLITLLLKHYSNPAPLNNSTFLYFANNYEIMIFILLYLSKMYVICHLRNSASYKLCNLCITLLMRKDKLPTSSFE